MPSLGATQVAGRFVAATAERLAEFRSRPLDDATLLVVFVDGFDFAGDTMVGGTLSEGPSPQTGHKQTVMTCH